MSFDWLSYVELAIRLIQQRKDDIEEAYLRASVSRAYYGVFGTLWDNKGNGLRTHGSKHHALIMSLQNSADFIDRKIGVDLDRLRRARNIADYETKATVTVQRALAAHSLAISIQSKVWVE